MANCWVCETASASKSHSRCHGACSACGERLRKKYGSAQWVAVATEAIACGNRVELLAHILCRGCQKRRVRVANNKSLLCDKCKVKAGVALMTEEERAEHWKRIYQRKLKSKRRTLLARQELAKSLQVKIKAVSAAIPENPYQIALMEARKDPARHVIPVTVGESLMGTTLYFEPVVKPDGTIGVRQLSNW